MNPKPIRNNLWRGLAAAGLIWLFAAQPASAQEVTAVGEAAIISGNQGGARNQALLNAQRNAVEMGVGLLLDSSTVSENFDIIKDKILTSSQGFVKSYKVLEEGKSDDGANYRVKIKATVAQNLLEDKLTALRILHKKMGNQRLMVIYRSNNPNALSRTHGATRSAMEAIQDEFNKAGFRLFNEEATAKVYKEIEVSSRVDRPDEDIVALALDQQADILVTFENIGGKRDTKGGSFLAAYSTIRISVFDATSGRQIATADQEGKKLLLPGAGPYDWEKGLSGASSQAARQAANGTISKIVDYYKNMEDQGGVVMLVFRGYDDDQKNTILDFLETTPGFKQLSELKNTPLYLEVELFSNENPSRLRRIIHSGLKDKGLPMQTQSASRNRVIFLNPYRGDGT